MHHQSVVESGRNISPFLARLNPHRVVHVVGEGGVLGHSRVLARDESGDARVGALDELEAVVKWEVCSKTLNSGRIQVVA